MSGRSQKSGVASPTRAGGPRPPRGALTACVIVALSTLLLSCAGAGELTRAGAADLIRNSEEFRLPVTATLPGKREWPTEARTADEPEEEARARAVDGYARTNPELAAFRHLGLIDFKVRLVEGASPAHAWWRFELEPVLTEKGERAAAGAGDKRQKEIAVARRELVEVTGLTAPQAGAAQAEFTWRQAPTPAGEAFDPGSETYKGFPEWLRQLIAGPPAGFGRSAERRYGVALKGSALLRRYDDGWRVQHIQF